MVKIKGKTFLAHGNRSQPIPANIKKKKMWKEIKSELSTQQNDRHSKIIKDNSEYKEIFAGILSNYIPRSTSHIQSGKDWISYLEKENIDNGKPIPLSIRKQLHELAEKIYNDDLKLYHQRNQAKHFGLDQTMRKNVITHGTTKDKIAAYVLQCMDTPLFSLKDLYSLVDFVSAKLKSQLKEAIDNVLKLFKNVYLPKGFVAKEFECHNFKDLIPFIKSNPEKVQKILVLWYFEDQLRLVFLKFAESLEKVSHDIQEKTKSQGVKGIQNLVKNHFNQDSEIILSMLVNKLGDSNNKIAGDTKNSLSMLSSFHPSLKIPLVSMVEELLYRSNVNSRTQYYCLCFLEDILFERKDLELPERLCKLYFDFFKNCSLKGEVNDRFMSAILRGLNRAFLFIRNKKLPFLEEQINAFYTLSHKTNFNISTQVLQLIYSISGSLSEETSDRFYNVLYEKIIDNDFGEGSSVSAFLNLVFKAMCKDKNKSRFCAFVRRLLQVIEYKPSQIGCGILFLISEAIKDNPNVTSLRDLGKFVFTTNVSEFVTENDKCNDYYSDSDNGNKTFIIEEKCSKNKHFVKTSKYLLDYRNPSYCGADLAPIWELSKVSLNFHPSVSLFASNLLSRTEIQYSGDPLIDFTLFKSLERFAHRNPKGRLPDNEHSKIFGSRKNYVPKGIRSISVVSEKFKKLDQYKVPPEDMFLYNYFTIYRKQKVENVKEEGDDDDSSVDDDEFEDYLKRINEAKNFGIESDNEDEIEFDFANKVNDVSVDDSASIGSQEDSHDVFEEYDELGSDLEDDENLDAFDNSDIEDLSFSEGSDNDEDFKKFKKKTSKISKLDDTLMDDDQFSHLLEEAANADVLAGTSEAMYNVDKSHARQLLWEKKRGKEMSTSESKSSLKSKNFKKPKKLKKNSSAKGWK